jgi:hypothetical protein
VTLARRWLAGRRRVRADRRGGSGRRQDRRASGLTGTVATAYCAEVVASTYQSMGLLGDERPAAFYDPGSFWSGDRLTLLAGARLGEEIRVLV